MSYQMSYMKKYTCNVINHIELFKTYLEPQGILIVAISIEPMINTPSIRN